MGLKGWLFGDFIEYLEWRNNDKSELFYKFPLKGKEIIYNAKLKVHEGEIAIFSIDRKVFDTLTYGEYILNATTLPNIANKLNWDSDYDEPFVVDVYFINRESYRFKWQTKEPILLHDKDNSIAKLEIDGYFKVHIYELKTFLNSILDRVVKEDYKDIVESILQDNLVDILLKRNSSLYALGAKKEEFSSFLTLGFQKIFNNHGLILDSIVVENLDVEQELPEYTGLESDMVEIDKPIYYIIKDSNPDGPYTKSEIIDFIKSEKLIAASYIWYDGLESWIRVKDIFNLEDL